MTEVGLTRSHPGFNMANYVANRATADVALVKLKTPLPSSIVPASLGGTRRVAVGETMIVAGFGATQDGNTSSVGEARMAPLVVTGQPGSLQIRLRIRRRGTPALVWAVVPAIPACRPSAARTPMAVK